MSSNKTQQTTTKLKGAAALAYDPTSEQAPRVVAKGMGYLAEKILLQAREHGIPIVEDKLLFDILYKLELGAEIPLEIYEPVARILAFVYSVYSNMRRNKEVHKEHLSHEEGIVT